AFNRTAGQLEQNRERLVYLTQIASWQTLARKMAHELKNSLTPIRLTVEEILARHPGTERQFMTQAAQIVVSEIESLERRVRAFSEFSAEPAVHLSMVDLNGVVEVHDSGAGLSAEALKTLFEPTITFKARGMGLGLSIARKDALVCGGDLILVPGKLGGAGFRLILPKQEGAGNRFENPSPEGRG